MNHLARLHFTSLFKSIESTNHIPSDLIVYLLYIHRLKVSPTELRSFFLQFVSVGFNPCADDLEPSSKVMLKSVIARCDSCIS